MFQTRTYACTRIHPYIREEKLCHARVRNQTCVYTQLSVCACVCTWARDTFMQSFLAADNKKKWVFVCLFVCIETQQGEYAAKRVRVTGKNLDIHT